MKLERISVTSITKALKCEMSLFYTLTQPKPKKVSPYLVVGSIFHSCLEQYFKHKSDNDIMTWNELEFAFEREFEKEKSRADFSKMSELAARKKCHTYLQRYYKNRCGFLYPKNANSVEVKMQFKVKYQERQILITGKADLITKDKNVIDHKTGRVQSDYSNDPQAHLYVLGLRSCGYDVKNFQFNIVNEKELEVRDVEFNQAKANELINFAFNLQRNFEEENLLFSVKDFFCKMCEWKGICEKFTGQEVMNNAIL